MSDGTISAQVDQAGSSSGVTASDHAGQTSRFANRGGRDTCGGGRDVFSSYERARFAGHVIAVSRIGGCFVDETYAIRVPTAKQLVEATEAFDLDWEWWTMSSMGPVVSILTTRIVGASSPGWHS